MAKRYKADITFEGISEPDCSYSPGGMDPDSGDLDSPSYDFEWHCTATVKHPRAFHGLVRMEIYANAHGVEDTCTGEIDWEAWALLINFVDEDGEQVSSIDQPLHVLADIFDQLEDAILERAEAEDYDA